VLNFLKNTDKDLFLFLNGMHCSFCDVIMPYLTSFWVWIPLFVWWLYEVYKKYKQKVVVIAVFVAALIFASDQSSGLIKKSVKRYRPTYNIEISSKVHTVDDYKGGQYGFVSSHAANSFAIALFLFLIIRPVKFFFMLSLFLYACVTCYTRIYLGVHYPLDILGGAMLGSALAFIFYKIYVKFFRNEKYS
jgi:undecaprenyl-diphosphatase